MIALSPEVGYIHEPFNPTNRPGICAANPDRYFVHVHDADRGAWASALKKTLSFQYAYQAEWEAVTSVKDILRMIRQASSLSWNGWKQRRALMKDPIAFFSAPWVAETFDAQVIVLTRHPAAFVSSLKRLGWDFPFDDLLSQPRLMKTLLAPFEEQLLDYQQQSPDVVDQGILLWKIFAHVTHIYQQQHPEWQFVRHEDVATAPIPQFRSLYDWLDLRFTQQVEETIRHHTGGSNAAEASGNATHDLKRDSRALTKIWKERLTEKESDRVFQQTDQYRRVFYPSDTYGSVT